MKNTFKNYFSKERKDKIREKAEFLKQLKNGLFYDILKEIYVGKKGVITATTSSGYSTRWLTVECVAIGDLTEFNGDPIEPAVVNRANLIYKILRKDNHDLGIATVDKNFRPLKPGDIIPYRTLCNSVTLDMWYVSFYIPYLSMRGDFHYTGMIQYDSDSFDQKDLELFEKIRFYI